MAIDKIGSAAITDSAVTDAKLSFNANQFRNIIINGDMSQAQRATSTSSITSGAYHTVDRFKTNISSLGTWTQSQDTTVPTGQGFAKSLKMDCTTADGSPSSGDFLNIGTRFEGQMLQYLKKGTSSAESLTLSFWVRSNKTGTYTAELYDSDNTRYVSKTYSISSADTWEKKTITYDGDTTGAFGNDNNVSLSVFFWLGAGSDYTGGTFNNGTWGSGGNNTRVSSSQVNLADSTSNEWYITGVQLEAGTSASDFEFLPFDVNQQRCQRYFVQYGRDLNGAGDINVGIGQWYSASEIVYNIYSPVRMRVKPTITSPTVSGGYRFHKAGSYTDVDTGGVMTNCDNQALSVYKSGLSGGTGGQATFVAFIVAGAKVQFSAEL